MPNFWIDPMGYISWNGYENLPMMIFMGICLLTIIFGILGSSLGRVRRGDNGDPVGSGNLGWIEWLTGFFRKR